MTKLENHQTPRPPPDTYAIIPAAGRSRRMGQHKLLLPWPTANLPDGKLIDAVLAAWTNSGVKAAVIVIRNDDEPLLRACEAYPVTVLQPDRFPTDMKSSVQIGLRHLSEQYHPGDDDRCFIAPADLPGLSYQLIDHLAETDGSQEEIIVPRFGEKLGHPALLPWPITHQIFELSEHEGVNCIVDRHSKQEVCFSADMAFHDIDTPEEYRAAVKRRSE